jgi:hypothetical protein
MIQSALTAVRTPTLELITELITLVKTQLKPLAAERTILYNIAIVQTSNLIHKVKIKFIYSEKATKFCKIFPLLLTSVHTVKSKGKISKNYVVFSEYMNFNMKHISFSKGLINGTFLPSFLLS